MANDTKCARLQVVLGIYEKAFGQRLKKKKKKLSSFLVKIWRQKLKDGFWWCQESMLLIVLRNSWAY